MKTHQILGRIQFSHPPQEISANIDIILDRELTSDESYFINQKSEEIIRLLRKNTIVNSDQHKNELKEEKDKIISCFGGIHIYVKPIDNGYGKNSLNPWFEVTTSKGIIVIGWRHRVINIDWEKSDIKDKADDLFPNENVTKDHKSIHAYGYDKATQYLRLLLS